ncbi:hypothetical protein MAM1_0086d04736 [Mucor ambiguus]|uniref:Uncharacterized protein n=1 Tax=Mucor ambiguus TaxID=91626 RepID=A0A0C9MPV5_9FUNG|nr:hypothetical protein MAM1_0086d04736 [Mucor ambiguus]
MDWQDFFSLGSALDSLMHYLGKPRQWLILGAAFLVFQYYFLLLPFTCCYIYDALSWYALMLRLSFTCCFFWRCSLLALAAATHVISCWWCLFSFVSYCYRSLLADLLVTLSHGKLVLFAAAVAVAVYLLLSWCLGAPCCCCGNAFSRCSLLLLLLSCWCCCILLSLIFAAAVAAYLLSWCLGARCCCDCRSLAALVMLFLGNLILAAAAAAIAHLLS